MNPFGDTDLSSLALDELLSMAGDDAVAIEAAQPVKGRPQVAIIGMSTRIAGCDDLDAFWALLRDGGTTRRKLPPSREADLAEYLRLKGAQDSRKPVQVFRESFLNEVDKFDHRFFGIAKQEANLMDPNQRLFLETSWAALEHAGYGGKAVKGSSTGVFVGFSADFGADYRDIVRTLAPDSPEVSVVGNVKSIIASRLAYHLDLRGPSMMVDTACSSGLVALHLACRALLAGDCDMALAGAVKVDLVPVADDPETGVGIKDIQATAANDGRTRTFDDDSEGTSGAEGVLAFVLKRLDQALADGDTIHAVVLGSAINQDGLSVGITAPNMAAQEALIVRALQEAEVHPDSISYIEAHGTATKLGDPIEVSGIARSYGRYTRRRQFCAIGSVKTNVGHLDNAAGLAGLAKVVMAMRHRQIPASLNFRRPNRKIAFEQAPVFVNDVLQAWQTPTGMPMRAGINSFGLSGTNCHVIVEAPPAPAVRRRVASGPHLLPLSAMTDHALERLLQAWHSYLAQFEGRVQDLCFTAALGRLHHNHRVAICFDTLDDLRACIQSIVNGGFGVDTDSMFFGNIVPGEDRRNAESDSARLSDADRKQLDRAARDLSERALIVASREIAGERKVLLQETARLYVRGAELEWEHWFEAGSCGRIPLPTYPFARIRCWVATTEAGERLASRSLAKQFRHPLLDRCAALSKGVRLYETMLGVDSHWELGEHKVQGHYILPGTAFIEMVLEVAAQMNAGVLMPLQIEQLVFLRPFALVDQQRRAVQVLLSGADGVFQVQIVSRPDGFSEEGDEWEVHAEAVLRPGSNDVPATLDVAQLKAALTIPEVYLHNEDERRGLEIGDRWNLSVLQAWSNTERDALLVHLSLPEAYQAEANVYHYHPALLDTAVNAANHLAGEGVLYLPFSYKRLEVFKPLPTDFHASLCRKPGTSQEVFHFDIDLIAADGTVCARATDYTVKRVTEGSLDGDLANSPLHVLSLLPVQEAPQAATRPLDGPVLLLRRDDESSLAVAHLLRESGVDLIEVVRSAPVVKSYGEVLASLDGGRLGGVVYALAWEDVAQAGHDLDEQPTALLHDLREFIAACGSLRLRCSGAMLLLAQGGFVVEDHAIGIRPHVAALAGLARIARLENPQQRWRCLDSDHLPDGAKLLAELTTDRGDLSVWRQGVRYGEHLATLPHQDLTHFAPRHEGVYLITGGTGGLGLELAAHMAARGPLNIALMASSALPPRDEWEDILGNASAPEKTRRCIARVLALAERGAVVKCIAADVSDAVQMEQVLSALRLEFGRINGIVHAAGRAGEGFLRSKSAETFARVVAPKINGARVLHELTLGDPLDFFVMYSSVATVLRSAGQSDYTAGNAYLDSLAHFRRSLGLPAVSVCWPAWREVGIAVEYGAVDEIEFFSPISPAQALPLIEQVLRDDCQLPPVMVFAQINEEALTDTIDALGIALPDPTRLRLRRSLARRTAASERAAGVDSDVVLSGIEAPDDIVRTVAATWSRILGVNALSADDAFADHGGNSILTTQLFREYEASYPGVMDVADLFTHTTVREQAAFLRKALGHGDPTATTAITGGDDQDLSSILARLADGSLTAEEAEFILSS